MGYVFLLAIVGISLFGAVYLLARLRKENERFAETLPESIVQVNLLDNDDAIIVAEGRGRLVFANPKARTWFGMNGGEPDLELLADSVQPADTFLELFSTEGQASFRIGARRVEATSHYIPRPDQPQMVIVMRELVAASHTPNMLDPVKAMTVASEIGEIISANYRLDEMLDAILTAINTAIPYDVGEVTLMDEDLQILRSKGRVGESAYFEQFDSTDGVYHLDDSYSGWIARYRQPLLIADARLRLDVRPKLSEYPFQSFIGVPLIVGERFIGTLELGSRSRVAFDHEDMALLQGVAGPTAVAIENSRLYDTQSERVAELSGLQQIAGVMTLLRDRRQMYGQLTDRIAALMNVEMCGLLLYDADQDSLVGQAPFAGVPDAIVAMYHIPVAPGSVPRSLYDAGEWWYSNNVRADDLVQQTGLSSLAEAVGVRTTALVNMRVGARSFGVVQVANKRDGSGFSENDLRLLTVFASQVAIVVENARLYEEEQSRVGELAGLQEISRAIGTLHDVDDLYSQMNERIAKLMNAQMCGILLYDERASELVSRPPFYGVDPELVRHYQIGLVPGTSFNRIFREDEFWISNELRSDPILRESGLDKLAMLVGVRQTMMVPLVLSGRRLGLVQVSNRLDGRDFVESDARVLTVYASQAAVIIDNARLQLESRLLADQSESLQRIGEVVSQGLSLDATIQEVVGETSRMLDADICAVGLLDERSGELYIRPEWTIGLDDLKDPYVIDTFAPGSQSSVVVSRRPFMSNNLRADPRLMPVLRTLIERFNFNVMLQVPLVVSERGIGELTIARRTDHSFEADDLRRAEAIAGQMAAAVDRHRLYQATDADVRARILELDAITRISAELNRTTEFSRILEVIRDEAENTTRAADASIALLRPPDEWANSNGPEIERRIGMISLEGELAAIERRALYQKALVTVGDYNDADFDAQPPEARTAIAAPVAFGEQIVGVLHIYSRSSGAFTIQTQDFLKTLVNQIAIAYGNEARYREQLDRADLLTQRNDQLTQIFELGRMLRSGEPIEDVLEAVAHGISDTVGFNVVVISLIDRAAGTSRRVAQSGLPLSEWDRARKTTPSLDFLEARLMQPRYQISSSYFIPGEELPDVAQVPSDSAPITRSPAYLLKSSGGPRAWLPEDVLVVPLQSSSGDLIGVMSVDAPRDGRRPTRRTIEALETFASQAAFAIENYQLVQAYQSEAVAATRERDQLEQMHLVASEIQRAPDIPSRLQVVADGIRAAGWERVAITLRGPDLEPAELITAGFAADETVRLRASLLSGVVWRERLADPEFRRYRIGQAYYVRHSDPLVTENKLMAGIETPASDEVATPDRWHPLDTLYLPLYGLDQSRLVGIIAMDSPQDGTPPTETELRPIELFAAQAAFAIENTRLYQGMTTAAQQEARINEVTEAVTTTLELNEIIQGVAAGFHQMIAFSRMSVGLLEQNAQRFDMLHVSVDAQGNISTEPGDPIAFEGSAMGRAVQEAAGRSYDLAGDGQAEELADLGAWREAGEKAALVVPMMAGGRVVGALNMASRSGDAEELEAQVPLVSRIANLTAVAIENAQLFQQTIERERFSSALTRVGASVNTMLNMSHVLATVCEESIAILDVAGAYVWLLEGDELVGIAARGPGESSFPGTRVRLDEADVLGSTVIQERAPAYVNVQDHVSDTPQSTIMARVLKDVEVGAMLGVPLIHEARATGAVVFIQTGAGKGFADTDIEKASAFASQAAIAIENARLYQETLGLKSFNEAVVESIQQGIIVLNRDKSIRTVNAYMRDVYGWSEQALGQMLFAYRPRYMDFLQSAVDRVLHLGEPESRYGIRDEDEQGQPVVRNFYVYPLREGQTVSGIVILVEDVTTRAALEADIARRERQLTVLTEISTQLTSTLDPDAVTRLMLDNTDRILDFDCATLWLRNEDKLVIQAARGYADAKALIGIEAEIADSELFRELATRGQVLNIPDITMDSRFPPASESHLMRSWLGISLVSRGRLAGLLVLEKTEPDFYTPTMEQLALTFANQVAVALENADLFQKTIQAADENTRLYRETASRARELDQQAQRLSLLYRVSNALTQSLDLEDVYEVALRETIGLLNVDRGGAFFFDNETRAARLVIEYPRRDAPPSDVDAVPLEGSQIITQLRSTLQPVVIRDVLAEPRLTGRTPGGRQALSCLIVPLTVSGQIIGMLEFYHQKEYRDFTPEQVEVAQTIASQAAIAVQNANLLEQSLARTRELELLFDATQSISATLELDTVLRSIAMQMIIAMDVDACQILNYNAFDEALKVSLDIPAEASSVVTEALGAVFRMADNPTMRRAMQTGQVILLRADDAKSPEAEREILHRRQVHSRVLVPMHVREQPVGLITLDVCSTSRVFTGGEVRLARTLSAQAAVAIENAGLQTETTSKLEELFVINDLSTALAANIDQEGVYDIVRLRLPTLIKAQWLLVATLDPVTETLSYPVALRNGVPVEIEDHPLGDDEISFVVRQRMPQRLAGDEINDVLRNSGARLRVIPARCFMGVPMTSADQTIGALVIGDETNANAFNLNDQRILSTVGAQIAVALQNARLFTQSRQFAAELERAVLERTEELQRERDSISFLYQLTANLTSSLDIDITLNRALSMMTDAIGADRGVILGIDSISDRLVYRAGYHLPFKEGQAAGLSPREGLAGWVIQTQRSVLVPDVQKDYRWVYASEWEKEPRAAIGALLEANEETLGVVMLFHNEADSFDEDQLRLVEAAAKQIASAMNNADLYTLIREQAERLGAMVRREQVESTKNLAIVESIADGVMVANQDGEIVQFNNAAERILGMGRSQVMGSHISSLAGLYSSSGGQHWLDAIEKWTADPTLELTGQEIRAELSLDNGRFISVILSPVNIGDQFLGTVSVFRDITREIEVDRMKSEFVATVSHELRTPMTSIKGYADLLLLGAAGQVTDQQQKFLSTIKTNADRLSLLVNELLDISRLDRGAIKLNLQPTNVAEVVELSLRQLEERIAHDGKTVEITSHLPDDLPLMRADFDKMTQILSHLLNNAYSYTYAGGSIHVEAAAEERSVMIQVSDTGIGISKEKQERIWSRFFRDEEQMLVMETSGAGLGLAIVREYVSLHQGDIWLESEPGKGTTFFVRIPAFTSA